MARPSKGLRYVEPHRGRDGVTRYYFRCRGARTPMPLVDGDPKLDPAFMSAYATLFAEATGHKLPAYNVPRLARTANPVIMRAAPDSVGAAINRYYRHSTFAVLAPDTQESHRGALNRFAKKFGREPLSIMDHEAVQEAIKPLEPWPQRHLVTALRRFVRWARATGEMDTKAQDPTLGLALHDVPKIKGHQPWTTDHHKKFEKRWPIGTRQRLAYEIMLRLGLRRRDVHRLGPQHVTNGWLLFQPRKTSRTTAVWLDQPFDTRLAQVIAATTVVGTETYLVNDLGKPFAKSSFAAFMRRAYRAAGVPETCRNHGLRKNMMLELVEAEVRPHDIMALSGHSTLKEIENYTRNFDRRKAAIRAMQKRENNG